MEKLINVAMFMVIYSSIALSSTIAEAVVYLVLAGVLYLLATHCKSLVDKINEVHEYTLNHKSDHAKLEKDIDRIDGELEEMKKQFLNFDHKLDLMMREIKK